MRRSKTGTALGLAFFAVMFAVFSPTVAQDSKKETAKAKTFSVAGVWSNSVRHAVHNHLYQPVQGARDRDESMLYFSDQGGRLTGFALCQGHEQEDWNKEGRTDFRDVNFEEGRLTFEFDVEMNHGRRHQTKSKSCVRVEASPKGADRLVGRWRILEKSSGAELFRGEWEALRTKTSAK